MASRQDQTSTAPLEDTCHNQGPSLSRPWPVPDLLEEFSLVSRKPRSDASITLVTQLSPDRLPYLEAQCRSWGGVVRYIPSQEVLYDGIARTRCTD